MSGKRRRLHVLETMLQDAGMIRYPRPLHTNVAFLSVYTVEVDSQLEKLFYLATQASLRMGNHGRREAEIEAEMFALLLTALADTEAERCARPDPVSRSIVVECRQAWIVYDVLHAIEKARAAYAAAWALQRVE